MRQSDEFINIHLKLSNIDNYYVRKSIFTALNKVLPEIKGELFDLGCGNMPYKEYLLNNANITQYTGCDINNPYYDNQPDILWDGKKIPCKDNSFDTIISTELYEHCLNIDTVLSETYRILKDDGLVFFTVPFLWVLHDEPYDYYRYTPYALYEKFKEAGFSTCGIYSLGNWEASLGTMLGLYARRKPCNRVFRMMKSIIIYPLVWTLFKLALKQMKKIDINFENIHETNPEQFFEVMNTGFFGIARK